MFIEVNFDFLFYFVFLKIIQLPFFITKYECFLCSPYFSFWNCSK